MGDTGAVNLFLAAVAVLGVSLSGPLMAAAAAPALAIAFWRNAGATVGMSPLALTRHRSVLTSQSRRTWLLAVVAGAALAAHFGTWASSLKLTSVAAAIALVSMQVLWVIAIEAWRGKGASMAIVAGAALALAGVVMISGVDLGVSRDAIMGDALAVAGGLFAAIYVVVGSQVRETMTTTAYTFACYGVCASILLVVCVAARVPLTGFSAHTWLLIAAVTLCAQFLGHSIINHLLAVMSPTVISMILLLEVPCAALIAAIWLGESLQPLTYVGIVLIMVGLAVVTILGGRDVPAETLVAD